MSCSCGAASGRKGSRRLSGDGRESWNDTFATQGIRCNGICPGFTGHDPATIPERMHDAVRAGMLDQISAEQEYKIMALAPRGGTAEEIAEAYYFVGSPPASFLNGATVIPMATLAAIPLNREAPSHAS